MPLIWSHKSLYFHTRAVLLGEAYYQKFQQYLRGLVKGYWTIMGRLAGPMSFDTPSHSYEMLHRENCIVREKPLIWTPPSQIKYWSRFFFESDQDDKRSILLMSKAIGEIDAALYLGISLWNWGLQCFKTNTQRLFFSAGDALMQKH